MITPAAAIVRPAAVRGSLALPPPAPPACPVPLACPVPAAGSPSAIRPDMIPPPGVAAARRLWLLPPMLSARPSRPHEENVPSSPAVPGAAASVREQPEISAAAGAGAPGSRAGDTSGSPGPTRTGGQQMAQGARIDSVVMFVRELDRSVSFYLDVLALEVQVEAHRPVQLPYRSVSFYLDVLALEVADRSPTAALLAGPGGTQLI